MPELQIVSRRIEIGSREWKGMQGFARYELGRAATLSSVVHEYIYDPDDQETAYEARNCDAVLANRVRHIAADMNYHNGIPVVRYPDAARPTALVVASYLLYADEFRLSMVDRWHKEAVERANEVFVQRSPHNELQRFGWPE